MAELNLTPVQKLMAATSALTLTTSRRLIRNFTNYREESAVMVDKAGLIELCHEIRRSCFSLHNLLENEQEFSPFFVSISGDINDRFEELHRKLLYFPANSIDRIIPIVDRQRLFWKNLTNAEFYNNRLSHALEHSIPPELSRMEKYIKELPESAIL